MQFVMLSVITVKQRYLTEHHNNSQHTVNIGNICFLDFYIGLG